jgi:catechol 2,3-dioxygenase-like lactoylglutathione lyase family enzyme
MVGNKAVLGAIWPCLIVRDLDETVAFYRDRLGFDVTYLAPETDAFFAILRRDDVHLMVKHVAPEVLPVPNVGRHPFAPWDAYVYVPEPDLLAEEFALRGVEFCEPLDDNDDNLRGFTVRDVNGYVLFFGRPCHS